jgi:hypothetical protein
MNKNYYHDTDEEKAKRVYGLLEVILQHARLTSWERDFLLKMQTLIRYGGKKPTDILTEPQARTIRSIVFKKKDQYHRFLNPLPNNVPFENEVRRLLKSQPNPNERRNIEVREAKAKIERIFGLKDVRYRYSKLGYMVFTGVSMRSQTHMITDRPHRGPHPRIVVVKDGNFVHSLGRETVNLTGERDEMTDAAIQRWFLKKLREVNAGIDKLTGVRG